ncbi:ORF67A [Alcelaphine gammaherpesvirus 1]|uniref:Tripartite terminase subunit 2 n=1 Tax=Alcelaphine herpesvirus 1 (strain C500) TaxID=654901 RepID=TRM2_ALHV1|nr:ORF67A [Alcelaphine gammaherpesvirus 1]O36418.1 RecName: Full=Tripartite terminase subunit 2 [Alcelaphine herpesvirus 1 strain C500]AAC58115.1 ORF67A [Alcelaphine gammaherpesvirus 1]APB09491.1 DNA packaging protein UL33 [Alcelaphine gammaherpesvirus 1]APB09563.1 DNA packaging protein UL33 [Alcelaphine gammaherpesvirus 1]ATI21954.1 ORF67.5 [Alcelaphine gammaherpesvirus 1]QDY92302.1 DNA packaging protein UL33 [Alcelaphine gammaherpesvirus 1]
MDLSNLLDFPSILPEDIQVIAPTSYAKLSLLSHCQHLKLFIGQQGSKGVCAHSRVLEEKLEAVKEVISKIIETDKILEKSEKFL